jgi:hypothetical protein
LPGECEVRENFPTFAIRRIRRMISESQVIAVVRVCGAPVPPADRDLSESEPSSFKTLRVDTTLAEGEALGQLTPPAPEA